MLERYEIKTINNEDILYLYFDIDSEFGSFFKEKNIKEKIKQVINNNKILFRGTTVAIVVSGLLVGHVYFDKKEIDILPQDNIQLVLNEKEEIDNIIEYDIEENDNIIYNSVDENIVEYEEKEEKIDDKIYININRNSGIVELELEEYVLGVLGAEMPASFNIEALKAGAVVARTYALKSIKTGRILTDDSSTQNYKDNEQLKSMWNDSYDMYYEKIKKAVNDTSGLYLSYDGDYIEALYHSTSNGQTEDAINVWNNSYPYLVSVSSEYDETNPSFIKEQFFSYDTLSSKLNSSISNDTQFIIMDKTTSNRVKNIKVNDKEYNGVEFRNILGLRSTDFEINKTESGVIFRTKGYGHGVGMSQYGANGMAKNGYNYEEILLHYYPGVTLSHL